MLVFRDRWLTISRQHQEPFGPSTPLGMKIAELARIVIFALVWLLGCEHAVPLLAQASPELPDTLPTDMAAPEGVARLHMYNLHTGESIDVAYRENGQVLPGGVAMLDHFLRDWRVKEDAFYPVAEFDLLHAIMARLGRPNGLIQVICGYRTAQTNQMLRTRAPVTGVAEESQHILSRAIDIRVPGVDTARLRDIALSFHAGGVGYYPRSHFVHVDMGPVRHWSFAPRRRHQDRRHHILQRFR